LPFRSLGALKAANNSSNVEQILFSSVKKIAGFAGSLAGAVSDGGLTAFTAIERLAEPYVIELQIPTTAEAALTLAEAKPLSDGL
jgi:hypothetical protein